MNLANEKRDLVILFFFRAIITVSSFTLISRILGFVRDILIAAIIGPTYIGDAFLVSFKIPNFFRRLFAEGAFSAAFVPVFSEVLEQKGKKDAILFAEQVLAIMISALFICVVIFEIFMPFIILIFAPGFLNKPEHFDLTIQLTRLTFPYLLFISLVSLMGGILNSLGRFTAVASTPILLNLCLIGAILIFSKHVSTPGHALAWGVSLAGILQFLWVFVALRNAGVKLKLKLPKFSKRIKSLFKLMIPGIFGAGVIQVNLLADVIFASLLSEGSISYLYYADRINQLPVGVFGVAIGTALLPLLSKHISAGAHSEAMPILNRAIRISLFFAVPAMMAIFYLSFFIVEVLFERGLFTKEDTNLTAIALIGYASGLPAYILIKVLSPSYFARKNTSTPVKFAIFSVFLNILLNFSLIWHFEHVGLAIATAISAWFNVLLLVKGLIFRGWWAPNTHLYISTIKIIFSSMFMILLIFLANNLFFDVIGLNLIRSAKLSILILFGLIVYLSVSQIIGIIKLEELFKHLKRN